MPRSAKEPLIFFTVPPFVLVAYWKFSPDFSVVNALHDQVQMRLDEWKSSRSFWFFMFTRVWCLHAIAKHFYPSCKQLLPPSVANRTLWICRIVFTVFFEAPAVSEWSWESNNALKRSEWAEVSVPLVFQFKQSSLELNLMAVNTRKQPFFCVHVLQKQIDWSFFFSIESVLL